MTSARSQPLPRTRPAFTLVELLVVIGIIGVLIGLATAIGSKVMGSAKANATRNTIQALDQILATYVKANDGRVPAAYVFDPLIESVNGTDPGQIVPVLDGVYGAAATRLKINSVGLFLHQCKLVGDTQLAQQIQNLPSKVVASLPVGLPVDPLAAPATGAGMPSMVTVIDAWGRPIRYVHPSFDGTLPRRGSGGGLPNTTMVLGDQTSPEIVSPTGKFKRRDGVAGPLLWNPDFVPAIRRNFFTTADRSTPAWQALSAGDKLGDADGGVCQGNQPYFYSAGPDGDPSTLEDNVYTTLPTQPKE